MRDHSSLNRPMLLLRLFQVFALLGAIPFLINTADIILHPFTEPLDVSVSSRLATGLVIAPLTVVIAVYSQPGYGEYLGASGRAEQSDRMVKGAGHRLDLKARVGEKVQQEQR